MCARTGGAPGSTQICLPYGTAGAASVFVTWVSAAAIAEISFAVDRWEDVRPNSGELSLFVRPRDLDPALGPDQS